jgi:hypothetical protein
MEVHVRIVQRGRNKAKPAGIWSGNLRDLGPCPAYQLHVGIRKTLSGVSFTIDKHPIHSNFAIVLYAEYYPVQRIPPWMRSHLHAITGLDGIVRRQHDVARVHLTIPIILSNVFLK